MTRAAVATTLDDPARPDVFLIPGALDTPTGGFRYDRRIIEGLRQTGRALRVECIAGHWPVPTPAELSRADAVLQSIRDDSRVIIDGLALGAMPDMAARHGRRLRLIGLVHHPLWLEAATSDEQCLGQPQDPQRRRQREDEIDALAATRQVIVTSTPTAVALGRMGVSAQRLNVIEPGCDRRELAPGNAAPPLRLICVATVTPRKDHLALIDALSLATTAGAQVDWQLDVVGSLAHDPAQVARVRARIAAAGFEERITLVGELDEVALAQRYLRADAMVMASRYEGYGMSLVEALMHGLPLVVTCGGAIADTVAGGARLVPAGDSTALAEAIRESIFDPVGRQALAAQARRWRDRQADRLGWPQAVARFGAVLDRV